MVREIEMTKEEFAKENGLDPEDICFYTSFKCGYDYEIIKEEPGTEPCIHVLNDDGTSGAIISLIENKVIEDNIGNILSDEDVIDFLNEKWDILVEDWNKENNTNFDFTSIERPIYTIPEMPDYTTIKPYKKSLPRK